jgi:raffinose/stachyose/melibiose transport system permease protein
MTARIRPSRVFQYLFVGVFCLLVLIPISYVVLSSLKTNEEINRVLSLPAAPNLDNYAKVIQNPLVTSGLLNSLFITGTSMLIAVTISALAGYAIGRARTRIFVAAYLLFLSSLMIPNIANMAALYSMLKNLGLLNSRVGLILIYTAGAVPVGVLLYAGFIRAVPLELDEAAMLDGCGFYRRFWSIILPLMRPAIITHVALSATGIWNDFFMPFLFITSDDKKTLPLAVYTFQGNRVTDYGPIFAMLVLAVLPLVIFFLFSQRYFYNSVAGSLKG